MQLEHDCNGSYDREGQAESSLTLHVTDVTPYLTLNQLFNRISSPFIIAYNESEVQKHSALTFRVQGMPLVTFSR